MRSKPQSILALLGFIGLYRNNGKENENCNLGV